MTTIQIEPIDPSDLARIRDTGSGANGVPNEPIELTAGQQLRCCLRLTEAGEDLLLISYAPLAAQRPWREAGPVFVHAGPCPEPFDGQIPAWFDDGPRVLRAYDRTGAMLYAQNRKVEAGAGVPGALEQQFDDPAVAEVHVRNDLPQCFIAKAVRR